LLFYYVCNKQGLYSPNKKEGDKKSWVEPESVPQCLLSHLRTCTIWYSEGLQSQLILATYILKNAYVLQTMKISSGLCSNISEKSKFSECPKASATCQLLWIVIHIDYVSSTFSMLLAVSLELSCHC